MFVNPRDFVMFLDWVCWVFSPFSDSADRGAGRGSYMLIITLLFFYKKIAVFYRVIVACIKNKTH